MIWKFRTMRVDAEAQLDDLLHLNEHDGVLFKIQDDPGSHGRPLPSSLVARRAAAAVERPAG